MQSETFYLDVVLEAGKAFPMPDNHEDRGVYVTEGSIEVAGDTFESGSHDGSFAQATRFH